MAFISTAAISSGLSAQFVLNQAALAASENNPSSNEPHNASCGGTESSSSSDKESFGCASGIIAVCIDPANPNHKTVVIEGSCPDTSQR